MYRTATLLTMILAVFLCAECINGVCYRGSAPSSYTPSYNTYYQQPSYNSQPTYYNTYTPVQYYTVNVPSYSYTPVYYAYDPYASYQVVYSYPVYSSGCSSCGCSSCGY